jgi:crossover junction endodeoxyribonuclease RuvC
MLNQQACGRDKDGCRLFGAGCTLQGAVDLDPMRVFGIDCGTEITGFGVVESDDSGLRPRLMLKAMGAIRLKKALTTAERLEQVFRTLVSELREWQPDTVAIEEVFYSVNAKSALKLGQVRGVALLAAATLQLQVAEYAPLKIKSSVVGYGLAKKEQVQFMVARLLELSEVPEPADAADALAIAICHIHTAQTMAAQGVGR